MTTNEVQKAIEELRRSGYEIPEWCTMHPLDHLDGVGGCWAISYGYINARGEDYCKNCEFYRGKNNNV